jgi:DNA uptake protein ComE-like DNA-binding protein
MDRFRDFFRNWFGYSRRERRSTFILLNLIVIITGIRYVFPFQEVSLKEIPIELLEAIPDTDLKKTEIQAGREQKQTRSPAARKKVLDLNDCDSAALEALPGIGPVLSVRIIKYRNLLGGYASRNQLKEVYGLSEETFELISQRVFADSLAVRKIKVNVADFRVLIKHPYFTRAEVSAILKYRELKGVITDIGVMVDNKLISSETANRIRAYLDFGE